MLDQSIHEHPAAKKSIDILTFFAQREFAAFSGQDIQREVMKSITIVKRQDVHNRRQQLEQAMAKAEQADDQDQLATLMKEFDYLAQSLNSLS